MIGAAVLGAACAAACAETRPASPTAPVLVTPVFRISGFHRTGAGFFYGLSVFSCGRDRVYWTMGGNGTKTGVPDTIRYGNPPAGYQTSSGPDPLVPGCYTVYASDRTPVRIVIDSAGRATAPADPAVLFQPDSGDQPQPSSP